MRLKQKLLVTGGGGFIGINVARKLNKKFDIYAITTKESPSLQKFIPKKNIIVLDINSPKLNNLLRKVKPDYIIHLASYGNSSEQKDIDKMIKVNIGGLNNLLQSSKELNYKQMIVVGSSSEYGFKKTKMKESDPLFPNSYYSATKGSATLLAQSFALIEQKPIVILRLFSVYGPYEKENRFIPTAIRAIKSNSLLNLTPGVIRRDFIYVDDVISAFEKALSRKIGFGEIFNVGTGIETSNDEVVTLIEKVSKKKAKLKKGGFPKRIWDTSSWRADTNKSRKDLGWKAKHSITDGLSKTYKYEKS